MEQCIFCKTTSGKFTTREHVLPESLGGGDWALLPDGLFCDDCQNKFGSTIEQQALADYPFSFFRVFLGVPTKKGKAPWLKSWEGEVYGCPKPGRIGYDPAQEFAGALENGTKTQMRLIAEPRKPDFVCRTMIKMGIEVVAADNASDALQEKFDPAREYALTGKKDAKWWYLQREDMTQASNLISKGITPKEWFDGVQMNTELIEGTAEVFHLKLLYLDVITPLEPCIQPPNMTELPEPGYRLFVV